MIHDAHQKVTSTHLKRSAYLYIRQSTIRQVFENTESTQRQYALQQNAIALGWPQERIIIIDTDLGQSGASAIDREGYVSGLRNDVLLNKLGFIVIRPPVNDFLRVSKANAGKCHQFELRGGIDFD